MGVSNNAAAQFQPATNVRGFKTLNVLMWYGYIPSVCNVRQTLMRGTRRRTEIIRVIMREFRCTVSIVFSSFSRFRCT